MAVAKPTRMIQLEVFSFFTAVCSAALALRADEPDWPARRDAVWFHAVDSDHCLSPVIDGDSYRRAAAIPTDVYFDGEVAPSQRPPVHGSSGWGNSHSFLQPRSDFMRVQATEPIAPQAPASGAPPLSATDPVEQAVSSGGDMKSVVTGWLKHQENSGVETIIHAFSVTGSRLNAALVQAWTDAANPAERVPGVVLEKRTPTTNEPVLQGRRQGQNNGRGSYWFPARQDMDTLLSKIDSRIVRDVTVIKGPYSALYGPGLAFYDVQLLETPRYSCGFDARGASSLEYKTNGEQWHGRQSFTGGAHDWGFRVGYGHRVGSDYSAGDGSKFPSSYNSRTTDVALGGDLTRNSNVEFNYIRLDETDVEIPGQLYDFEFLKTDAFDLAFTVNDQPAYDELVFESWYNRTQFDGDIDSPAKRNLLPFVDESTTAAAAMSTGYSLKLVWGQRDSLQLSAGSDLRYLEQALDEHTIIQGIPQADRIIPKAHSSNPGLFAETSMPIGMRTTIRSGARVDWVSTNAERFRDLNRDGIPDDLTQFLLAGFDQNFALWSWFLTSDYQLTDRTIFSMGFGHSMRPPTMTELYAINPFVAILPQYAFTNLFGNPELDPERMWQIDVGLRTNRRFARGGINFFHSWIHDYIALDFLNPPGGFTYTFTNTNLATLAGFDAYSEIDLTSNLTLFGNMQYVEGRDQTRDDTISVLRGAFAPGTPRSFDPTGTFTSGDEEPLPAIPPLEARVGLQLHDPLPARRWAIEFAARIVNDQDRVATSLTEFPTPGFTVYDLRSYWRPTDSLLLSAGVENLTDKFYQEHLDTHIFGPVYQPGVNFYFGSELTY
jgi:iron complex outermembrane receptor protein